MSICGSKPPSFWESPKLELADYVRTQQLYNGFVIPDVILDIVIISMLIPIVRVTSLVPREKQPTAIKFVYWGMLETGMGLII